MLVLCLGLAFTLPTKQLIATDTHQPSQRIVRQLRLSRQRSESLLNGIFGRFTHRPRDHQQASRVGTPKFRKDCWFDHWRTRWG